MRAPWLVGGGTSRARDWARIGLAPAAWLYTAGAALHRGAYRAGLLRSQRLPLAVVGIGSLVAGGAGKTPTAAWLASALHGRGHAVVLASRGHRRRGRDPVLVVSDGRFVRSRAAEAGDEPMVLAARAPGVPVIVGRDRVRVGWRALSAFGADILVLDDGFQHHRLRRDLDLVVFDGATGFGGGGVLPSGPLRESPRVLGRADAVGVVDGPLPAPDEARVARLAPDAFRFASRRRPLSLRRLSGRGEEAPEWLAGREVGLLCGLGQPLALRRSVEALGARVVAERLFGDHHRYRPADVRELAHRAPLWVTTEKDAVKLPAAWCGGADVRVLAIELAVEDADALLDWVEARLR